MSGLPLEQVVAGARAQGLLPPDAQPPVLEQRPWPVVLLTALGAWLSALPLLAVVGTLLGPLVAGSLGPYLVGVLLLVAACVVLRSRAVPLFVEQLAVPALLVGGGALGFGLFRDAGTAAGALLLAGIALALAAVLPAAWLRAGLGAAAAMLLAVALPPERWRLGRAETLEAWWLTCHALLLAWLLAHHLERHRLRGHAAAALESIAAGWGLALLGGLAAWSGMSFLVGGAFGGGLLGEVAGELGRRAGAGAAWRGLQAASAALALLGAALAAVRWPVLRRPALAGAAIVLAGLAALMPALGGVLLLLALLATSGRARLAAAAGVAAAWIVGAFYYQLAWPLAQKAAWLVAAGAVLGALAWWAAGARAGPGGGAAGTAAPRWARAGVVATLLAVLAVANLGIRDKEALIRDGRPVFVELAPVDPRSLLQGDFMRLAFALPRELAEHRSGLPGARRPHAVAQLDARGVARLLHIDRGEALQPEQLRIELTPKDGRWILVTDAWFFAEGEATRWARARYGEFRVDAEGRALLVGLRGAQLEPL